MKIKVLGPKSCFYRLSQSLRIEFKALGSEELFIF